MASLIRVTGLQRLVCMEGSRSYPQKHHLRVIKQLSSLRYLELSPSEMPCEILRTLLAPSHGLLNLGQINLEYCELNEEGILLLSHLPELSVLHTSFLRQRVWQHLKHCKRLRCLDFAIIDDDLPLSEEQWEELSQSLRLLTHLEKLKVEVFCAFPMRLLESTPQLRELQLSRVGVSTLAPVACCPLLQILFCIAFASILPFLLGKCSLWLDTRRIFRCLS
jgi:hypothetical protein